MASLQLPIRREIDGLRSVAVIPVILYHMGFSLFSKGFLGVDIFFVISGFLIGGILLRQLEETGTISFRDFYERRVRRIFPALAIMMPVVFGIAWLVLAPNEFKNFTQSALFANFSLSNNYFLNSVSYFDPGTEKLPLIHTWSLAVEEQFYIIFPLLLWAFQRLRFKQGQVILGISTLFATSFILRSVTVISDSSSAFYLLQFRAWELLAGVLAFFAKKHLQTRPWLANSLSSVGFILILISLFVDLDTIFWAGSSEFTAVLGSALFVAYASTSDLVGRLLSWKPFVGIGLISYSLYLWHQPIFALVRASSLQTVDANQLLLWLPIVFAVATASWYFIERPFRDRKVMPTKRLLWATATLSVMTTILAISITQPASSFASYKLDNNPKVDSLSHTTAPAIQNVSAAELEARLSPNYGVDRVCTLFIYHKKKCTTGSGTGSPTVALWGDSFSMHMVQALRDSPTKARFIAQTLITCNPVVGLAPKNAANGLGGARNCLKTNQGFFNYLMSSEAKSTIRTVILASHWENLTVTGKTTLDSRGVLSKDPAKPALYIRNTISALQNAGYRVVVFSSPAYTNNDSGACLVTAALKHLPLASCNFPLSQNQSTGPNALLEGIASGANKFVRLVPLMCPNNMCLASVGNTLIYRDQYHISREGSAYLGRTYDIMGLALG